MKKYKYIAILLCMLFLFTGCGRQNTADTASVKSNQKILCELKDKKSTKEKVDYLLGKMTLEEKAGQMVQGERNQVTAGDMQKYGLGSVLSGGGSSPRGNTTKDWSSMITNFQKGSMKSNSQIPFLYGIDAVHGLAVEKDAVVFPHNIGLGAANDPDLMYQMGAAVAEEMKLNKLLWNFGPCVAVNTDPRWGRTYECFSSDPAIVSSLASAYVKGQADHGVLSTAKHYAGDGAATYGTGEGSNLIDQGDTSVTEEEFRKVHLAPYKNLVQSGVKIIMASFSSYHGMKMHENKYLLTDVLKNEFGFQGFIVSDWEAVKGLSGSTYEVNIALAVNAGVDMLMEPYTYKEAINAIVSKVKQGVIKQERIDDAVRRILTVKFEAGLFDDPYQEKVTHEVKAVGSEKYREIAKKLVEKSLVLLKNDKNTLPIKKGQKIFVIGPAMNDMGLQCGGWGLTWQGVMDDGKGKVTSGTTILEGLKAYAKSKGFELITDKGRAKEADLVILAIGEIPYAEFQGDTKDLSITGSKAHPGNKAAIEFAKSLNKPTATLIVAGRNVLFEEYLNQWDSIVMCYLPGSEGGGVASVLSGEVPVTGKLPMPYYKSVGEIGKENPECLYQVGYGLTYDK